MFGFGKKEQRNIQDPKVPISSSALVEFLGLDSGVENVNAETALGVPAIWCAVNFISDTMASLPLNVYKKSNQGREKLNDKTQIILHDAPNDLQSSYSFRKALYSHYLTKGRGLALIEKDISGNLANLWILDPDKVEISIKGWQKSYKYDGKIYDSSEIIDLPFMEKLDNGGGVYSPIMRNKDSVALMIAVTKYGAAFFKNGGIPAHVYKTNANTPDAAKNARKDLVKGFKEATKDGTNAVIVHTSEDLKSLNNDPEKMQMIETQRFCIEQASRMFMLPPTFLHDLTHGTFSNTEQQGTQLEKYLIGNLANQFEQELNLKLFGRFTSKRYVELNLDGLRRGDYLTRIQGNATAIQTGQLTPNEARDMENRPHLDNGDTLLIQGATVPLGSQNLGANNG